MSIKLGSSKKKARENIGNGQYPARIVQIVDWGMQENEYEGDVKVQHRVWINFELPTKRIDIEKDGETKSMPRWLGKQYTLSSHEQSTMYKMISSIAPMFDFEEDGLEDLIGVECMVAVGTTSGGKDKVTGVNPPIDGMEIPELENDTLIFDTSDPDYDTFLKIPDWMKKEVVGAVDFEGSVVEQLLKANKFKLEA